MTTPEPEKDLAEATRLFLWLQPPCTTGLCE